MAKRRRRRSSSRKKVCKFGVNKRTGRCLKGPRRKR